MPTDNHTPKGDVRHTNFSSDVDTLPFPTRRPSQSPLRKPKSAFRAFIGIIVGGLAGTLFAYYVIAWQLGPAFDLPKFGLPYIDRLTAKPLEATPASAPTNLQTQNKVAGQPHSADASQTRPAAPASQASPKTPPR